MIRKYGLYAVWVVAMLATTISFYLTEVQSFFPCHLCWYQKICMYPLAIIVGIAAWRGNLGIVVYLLPQTIIGFILACFQLIVQFFSIRGFFPIQFCAPGPHCKETIAFEMEPLYLPLLSVLAFLFINCMFFTIHHIIKKH